MNKKKTLFLIPFLLVIALIIYCWATILLGNVIATWRHYTGILLFLVIAALAYKDIPKAVVGLGVMLLLATFNAIALLPTVKTSWLTIGRLTTPPVQLISFGILILYIFLNLDTLIEIYLDYKDSKKL